MQYISLDYLLAKSDYRASMMIVGNSHYHSYLTLYKYAWNNNRKLDAEILWYRSYILDKQY